MIKSRHGDRWHARDSDFHADNDGPWLTWSPSRRRDWADSTSDVPPRTSSHGLARIRVRNSWKPRTVKFCRDLQVWVTSASVTATAQGHPRAGPVLRVSVTVETDSVTELRSVSTVSHWVTGCITWLDSQIQWQVQWQLEYCHGHGARAGRRQAAAAARVGAAMAGGRGDSSARDSAGDSEPENLTWPLRRGGGTGGPPGGGPRNQGPARGRPGRDRAVTVTVPVTRDAVS